jgi:hypothetical protein
LKICSFASRCTIRRKEGAVEAYSGRRQAELRKKEVILINVTVCTEKVSEACRLLRLNLTIPKIFALI